jgi:hypothetical protein
VYHLQYATVVPQAVPIEKTNKPEMICRARRTWDRQLYGRDVLRDQRNLLHGNFGSRHILNMEVSNDDVFIDVTNRR